MIDIDIDKNVPIPSKRSDSVKYPFKDMEAGDSFYINNSNEFRKVCTAGCAYYKRNNIPLKAICRKDGDGFRVWVVNKENI